MRRALLVLALCITAAGCALPEPGVRLFWVTNKTQQTIVVKPQLDLDVAPKHALPGETVGLVARDEGCEARPWVALTDSGEVLATIPGGCRGHQWAIRGLNDSTYE
jgi:hypothetical protein